jgi:uncharacterized protein (DUF952 family)
MGYVTFYEISAGNTIFPHLRDKYKKLDISPVSIEKQIGYDRPISAFTK